jgi:hypothetical protein
MSGFNTRPITLNYGTKKEVVVTASAGTPQLIGELSGPIQVRLVNYDTSRVAFHFGTLTGAGNVAVATNPTLVAGATEVLTVMPNRDGTPVYWNIIGDGTPAGKTFEVTLGQGI